ncbi:MAG: hypothetical protein ACTSYS_00640, partial [Promethearchaeota archaeon]
LCLAKTARGCSYQRKGEHKNFRIQEAKIREFDRNVDVLSYFSETHAEYSKALSALHHFYSVNHYTASCKPILGNSMLLEGIKDNSIDLVVTSPPYGDSHTTVAYGQFSRFPLEWIVLNHDDVASIDNDLLGGKKQDVSKLKSRTLFKACLNILKEEMIQQNNFIEEYIEKVEKFISEIKDDIKGALKSFIVNFSEMKIDIFKMLDELAGINNLPRLVEHKNRYFKLVKELRIRTNNFRKLLRENRLDDKPFKFKVYNERLPFVLSFFHDFSFVFKRLFEVLDNDRKCCIVVGNRTVKRVQIPTDKIMIEMGKEFGFQHVTTYYREIPNKRMPKQNSPTNITGDKSTTIERESIIILEKPPAPTSN